MTRVTLTQPLENKFIFPHRLGNIPTLLFPHMHTPTTFNSLRKPQLHKPLILRLKIHKWGVLLYPSLEINLQLEAYPLLGGNF